MEYWVLHLWFSNWESATASCVFLYENQIHHFYLVKKREKLNVIKFTAVSCDPWLMLRCPAALIPRPAPSQSVWGNLGSGLWSPAGFYPAEPAADYPNWVPCPPTFSPLCEMSHSPACNAAHKTITSGMSIFTMIQWSIKCRKTRVQLLL